MGFTWAGRRYPTYLGAARAKAKDQQRETEERIATENAERMALADKIVMAVVDQISAAIIRPGPKPEERECYVMAQELRDFSPDLREVVTSILAVDAADPTPETHHA